MTVRRVSIVIIISASLLTGLAWASWSGLASLRLHNQRSHLSERLTAQAAAVDSILFRDVAVTQQALTDNPIIRAVLSGERPHGDPAGTAPCDVLTAADKADIVYVLDPDGLVVLSSSYSTPTGLRTSLLGKRYAFRRYFTEALAGRPTTYAAVGVTTGKRGIYCSAPVYDDEQQVIGVVVLKLGLDTVDALLSGHGSTLLSNDDGIIFAGDRPDLLFHHLSPLSNNRLQAIRTEQQYAGRALPILPFTLNPQSTRCERPDQIAQIVPLAATDWQLIGFEDVNPSHPLRQEAVILITVGILSSSVFLVVIGLLILSIRRRLAAEVALRASERKFRATFDSAYQFAALLDRDGLIIDINRAWTEMIGIEREALIGMHFDETAGWTHDPQQQKRLRQAIEVACHDSRDNFESHNIDAAQQERHIDFSITPLKNDQGKVSHLLSEGRDITERKAIELRLREQQENLRITLDAIGDAVVATDGDGLITRMNPAAELISGWSQSDSIGKDLATVFTVLHADNRKPVPNMIDATLDGPTKPVPSRNALLISRGGSEHRIDCTSAPIRDPHGGVVGFVLVFRDITEHLMMEEQLRHSQKLDSLGQLAGGVAHDFNNMLSGILGSADLLAERIAENDERSRKYITMIADTAERAADLTGKLLTFSRKGNTVAQAVNCHTCIEAALAILEGGIDKRIRIIRRFTDQEVVVLGDAAQLQNAILNLGLNARDAMPEGGSLTVTTERVAWSPTGSDPELMGGDYVRITVRDTGLGMDSATRERVFEPFFTTKPRGKGTGLGLSAVYGTVTEHHGRITVQSVPDCGTAFTILLPAFEQQHDDSSAEHSTTMQARRRDSTSTGCILLVDDDRTVRTTTRRMLQRLGFRVLEAGDGASGLAVYDEHERDIDLVILDTVMPRMNGVECLLGLRERRPDIRVLMTSGYTQDLVLPEDTNPVAFLKKPYRLSDLEERIRILLGGLQPPA